MSNTITRSLHLLIRNTIKKGNCYSLQSTNEEGFELIDGLASDEVIEDNYIKQEEKAILTKALSELSIQEKEITYWFFFENKSLRACAAYKEICYKTEVMRKKNAFKGYLRRKYRKQIASSKEQFFS